MGRPRDVTSRIRPVPDDVPRRHLYVEPIRVAELTALVPADHLSDSEVRVTFQVTIRDAVGKRCPDLAVEVRVRGPDRTAAGMVHTDLFGQAWIRMSGVPGTYRCDILDVAGGAIALERPARPPPDSGPGSAVIASRTVTV